MSSSYQQRRGLAPGASPTTSRRSAQDTNLAMQPAGIPQRERNDDSWVEIASQPSSSSLSSIGEEIVTTGLRVQNDRLRRRPQGNSSSRRVVASETESTSSQEEYEESESSDSDRVLSNSDNLSIPHFPPSVPQPYDAESESDDDNDENATALGMVSNEPTFRPQPNAFSHPPSSQSAAASRQPTGSQHTRTQAFQTSSRPTYPRSRTYQPTSHSPNVHADHDEALRASLTTLLSCAAAARGLPKQPTHYRSHSTPLEATANRPTNAPNMEIRMIPESELAHDGANPSDSPVTNARRSRTSPDSHEEKGKRKVSANTKATSNQQSRAIKKKKTAQVEDTTIMISPTLMTWMVGAGVMVLVSVVGFGAGYVIGREVGRQETLSGLNGSSIPDGSGSCGREVARGGLRRFKWGAGMRSVVA
ncbi:hypothetical protein F5884DRAFT_820247 [Xylogone sp. PMI_703]|nr:hypothetical protein F5884DRAFT_820247 [Xylogone sp. PMI_703]